ncbi:Methyltransferase like 15 [Paragonimus heterotremus]|uniref:Methyltransferase like 15 n=1 Tax=Paragonimus heterotremus TaxID=100268 RepID=A0A8J4WGP5_9TREM|nr:Methyltransferase like 15 [Paragonimus heterotremus]
MRSFHKLTKWTGLSFPITLRDFGSLRSNSVTQSRVHVPVMKKDVVELLDPQSAQVLLDMTFGAGGHTRGLLEKVPNLTCFCLDRDPEFLVHVENMRMEFSKSEKSVVPMLGKFSDLPALCRHHGLQPASADMILMDLGVSSMQLDSDTRGFSFKSDCTLDMRMDGLSAKTVDAATVLNQLDASDLAKIFKIYGEERFARRVANAILEHRHTLGPIRTTKQLADIITSVLPSSSSTHLSCSPLAKPHPATRIFQALRIFVNNELNELCLGLELAERLLKPCHLSADGKGGRLAVLSFHSLEDRLVKWALTNSAELTTNGLAVQLANRTLPTQLGLHKRQTVLQQLRQHTAPTVEQMPRWKKTMGPLIPTDEEIAENPRSRSAKLRAGEKA